MQLPAASVCLPPPPPTPSGLVALHRSWQGMCSHMFILRTLRTKGESNLIQIAMWIHLPSVFEVKVKLALSPSKSIVLP